MKKRLITVKGKNTKTKKMFFRGDLKQMHTVTKIRKEFLMKIRYTYILIRYQYIHIINVS